MIDVWFPRVRLFVFALIAVAVAAAAVAVALGAVPTVLATSDFLSPLFVSAHVFDVF